MEEATTWHLSVGVVVVFLYKYLLIIFICSSDCNQQKLPIFIRLYFIIYISWKYIWEKEWVKERERENLTIILTKRKLNILTYFTNLLFFFFTNLLLYLHIITITIIIIIKSANAGLEIRKREKKIWRRIFSPIRVRWTVIFLLLLLINQQVKFVLFADDDSRIFVLVCIYISKSVT